MKNNLLIHFSYIYFSLFLANIIFVIVPNINAGIIQIISITIINGTEIVDDCIIYMPDNKYIKYNII